jgi:hypothetical protein
MDRITTTSFPNGVGTRKDPHPFQNLPFPDPTKFHTFFEDFDYFVAANWTITETQAGATQALTDGDGGLLLLTNSAADNDIVSLQKVGESFRFATNKRLFFSARLQVSDATQSDFVVGLVITDTTPLDVTDGVFFQKDDGDALLDFYSEKNNTQTSELGIATVVAATFLTMEFYWDGVSKIYYGTDGVVRGFIEPSTNLPDDEDLTVTFAIQNGEAVAKTMTVDYIFAAKER